MATTGMGRSTARRMLTGAVLPDPVEQVDRRRLRPKGYSDDARLLLEHVWALMGCPCGKYLKVMLAMWLPLLQEAGDLDGPFASPESIAELEGDERRHDRPVPGARAQVDAAAGHLNDEAVAAAAQLDRLQQGR